MKLKATRIDELNQSSIKQMKAIYSDDARNLSEAKGGSFFLLFPIDGQKFAMKYRVSNVKDTWSNFFDLACNSPDVKSFIESYRKNSPNSDIFVSEVGRVELYEYSALFDDNDEDDFEDSQHTGSTVLSRQKVLLDVNPEIFNRYFWSDAQNHQLSVKAICKNFLTAGPNIVGEKKDNIKMYHSKYIQYVGDNENVELKNRFLKGENTQIYEIYSELSPFEVQQINNSGLPLEDFLFNNSSNQVIFYNPSPIRDNINLKAYQFYYYSHEWINAQNLQNLAISKEFEFELHSFQIWADCDPEQYKEIFTTTNYDRNLVLNCLQEKQIAYIELSQNNDSKIQLITTHFEKSGFFNLILNDVAITIGDFDNNITNDSPVDSLSVFHYRITHNMFLDNFENDKWITLYKMGFYLNLGADLYSYFQNNIIPLFIYNQKDNTLNCLEIFVTNGDLNSLDQQAKKIYKYFSENYEYSQYPDNLNHFLEDYINNHNENINGWSVIENFPMQKKYFWQYSSDKDFQFTRYEYVFFANSPLADLGQGDHERFNALLEQAHDGNFYYGQGNLYYQFLSSQDRYGFVTFDYSDKENNLVQKYIIDPNLDQNNPQEAINYTNNLANVRLAWLAYSRLLAKNPSNTMLNTWQQYSQLYANLGKFDENYDKDEGRIYVRINPSIYKYGSAVQINSVHLGMMSGHNMLTDADVATFDSIRNKIDGPFSDSITNDCTVYFSDNQLCGQMKYVEELAKAGGFALRDDHLN